MRHASSLGSFGAFPREKQLLLPGVEVNHVEGIGFLSYNPPVLSRTSQTIKQSMDVAISAPSWSRSRCSG